MQPNKTKSLEVPPNNKLVNFYELDAVKEFCQQSHNPHFNLHQIKVPFRGAVIGASGSMKSNLVCNLLRIMNNTFNKVEIYCRSSEEPLYQYLKKVLPEELFKIYEGLEHFNSLDLNKTYSKEDQTLIIFDDLCLEQNQSKVSEIYIRGRKLGVSTLYLSQKYFLIPKPVRGQLSYIFMKKISGKGDLKRILSDSSLGASPEQLLNMYKYCINNDNTSFLLLDLEAPQEKQYRKNFDEILNPEEFN